MESKIRELEQVKDWFDGVFALLQAMITAAWGTWMISFYTLLVIFLIIHILTSRKSDEQTQSTQVEIVE